MLTFGTFATATTATAAAFAVAVCRACGMFLPCGYGGYCAIGGNRLRWNGGFMVTARRLLRTRPAVIAMRTLTAFTTLTTVGAIALAALPIASAAAGAMLVAVTARALTRTITAAFVTLVSGCRGSSRGNRRNCRGFHRLIAEPAKNFTDDRRLCLCLRRSYGGRGCGHCNRRFGGRRGRTFRRQDAFDGSFLTRRGGIGGGGGLLHRLRRFDHFIARRQRHALIQIVVTQPGDGVIRRFQIDVRNQRDGDAMACFKLLNIMAFFVQEERRNVHRHLGMHGGGAFLHGFFLQDTQDVQRGGFGAAYMAGAVAARARLVAGFAERRAQPLAR